jgi:large subunit ribosomal protein L3
MLGIIGKKLGMTQIFNAEGQPVPVTVVEATPAVVMALKTQDKDGYTAIKVASGTAKEKHLTKADLGQFKKAGIAPSRQVAEFRLDDVSSYEVGASYDVSIFAEDKLVTVTGVSKGRGFAGTIKRHKFQRGPSAHGSKNVRAPGSLGAHSYPARVFPGKRLAGHHGVQQKTVKNLEVVKVDVESGLIFIKGAVPGAANGKVIVRKQNG